MDKKWSLTAGGIQMRCLALWNRLGFWNWPLWRVGDGRSWWYGCTSGTTLASHSTLSDRSNKESPQNRADVCGFWLTPWLSAWRLVVHIKHSQEQICLHFCLQAQTLSDHGALASVAHPVAGRGPYWRDAAHQGRSDNGYHHDMSRRGKEGACRHPDGTHARHPRSAGGRRS